MGAPASAPPRVVSPADWLAARRDLLAAEKELTRARDALAARRRRLPAVRIDTRYVFDAPEGPVELTDLFAGRRQLIVYQFMFAPDWSEGCPSCSFLLDSTVGAAAHLVARDTTFVVVSRAPVEKIERFRRRMGWPVRWVSSGNGAFNRDFAAAVGGEHGSPDYNFEPADGLLARGKIWQLGDLPGLSVFLCRDDEVLHTYSAYGRGLDLLLGTYNYLDLTPLGRSVDDTDPYAQHWVRHHDR